jgi:hypothetical protein
MAKRDTGSAEPSRPKLTNEEFNAIHIRRQYEFFRKKFFKRSKLPPIEAMFVLYSSADRIRKFYKSSMPKGAEVRDCKGFYVGDVMPEFGLIVVEASMDWGEVCLTLLHEMAHMAVEVGHNRNMGHGKVWQAEMLRLARAGAFKTIW